MLADKFVFLIGIAVNIKIGKTNVNDPQTRTPLIVQHPTLKNFIIYLALALCIAACAILFSNNKLQSASWSYPYFSGASNLGLDLKWQMSKSDYENFVNLPTEQQFNYRFKKSDLTDLVPVPILDIGYLYVVWVAQTLLFWLPPIKATVWFQILFHVFTCLWIIKNLGSKRDKFIFIIIYAINPLILRYATFAFYYYWQVLPALVWFWMSQQNKIKGISTLDYCVIFCVLAAAFFIRQSTALVSLFILFYAAWQQQKLRNWLAVGLFVVFLVFAKNPSQPWHTAYVGYGAYPNTAGIELPDNYGYLAYKKATGIDIDTSPIGGNYFDPKINQNYTESMQNEVFKIIAENPLTVIKNAILNTLQGFSIGYFVGNMSVTYLSSIIGLACILIFGFKKQYAQLGFLFFGVASFSTYFPPIPAYMFGNYLVLCITFIFCFDRNPRKK